MSEANLEKKIAELEHEIKRLQAINEIQNVLGKYESIHNAKDAHRSWELFAQHTPDTWMEISNWGMFEGIEEIKRVWQGMDPKGEPNAGAIFEHDLATPVIVVAKDCKTARATWMSPGHESAAQGMDGEEMCCWCWGKYAMDFIIEDGQWKIWHFKWFRTFISPFDTPWTQHEDRPNLRQREFGKPSKYHKPYSRDFVQESIPPAPAPYDTYTDDLKYWMFKPGIEES